MVGGAEMDLAGFQVIDVTDLQLDNPDRSLKYLDCHMVIALPGKCKCQTACCAVKERKANGILKILWIDWLKEGWAMKSFLAALDMFFSSATVLTYNNSLLVRGLSLFRCIRLR